MRNNRNSIVENVILFLVAIAVFAIIGVFGLQDCLSLSSVCGK